jgi:predicted transcriptional regulator
MTLEIDDELWAAIGDPTRRRVLDLLLAGGPGTASGLSRSLPVSRQAVAKHLTVLERAGLVKAEAAGREVKYGVDPEQFARAVAQLTAVRQAWDGRLRRIRALAEAIQRAADSR